MFSKRIVSNKAYRENKKALNSLGPPPIGFCSLEEAV